LAAQTGYARGLAGIAALAVIVPGAVQVLAFADGASQIRHAQAARSAWLRITAEVVVGGLLTVLLALPLAVAATPAGWLLLLLPVAGAYLLAIGFLVIKPRYGDMRPTQGT
jgi:cytochrome bd-type quinol oxidase subunit 2